MPRVTGYWLWRPGIDYELGCPIAKVRSRHCFTGIVTVFDGVKWMIKVRLMIEGDFGLDAFSTTTSKPTIGNVILTYRNSENPCCLDDCHRKEIFDSRV